MSSRRAVAGAMASMAVGGAIGALDYDPAFLPEELIDLRKEEAEDGLDIEVIAVGAVEEIVQGRDIWTEPTDDEPEHYLLLRVRVSEVLLADDQIADERVYVELLQAARMQGSQGRGDAIRRGVVRLAGKVVQPAVRVGPKGLCDT